MRRGGVFDVTQPDQSTLYFWGKEVRIPVELSAPVG
jgi:hypothetical protein